MTVTAHYTKPGDGATYAMIDGAHVQKAGGAETGGLFEVFEVLAEPAPAVPPHRSPWAAALYVVEGTVRAELEGQSIKVPPGGTVVVPAGAAFTLEVSGAAAKILAVTSGTGAGQFFADFAASVQPDRPMDEVLPQIMAVTQRHGVRVGMA